MNVELRSESESTSTQLADKSIGTAPAPGHWHHLPRNFRTRSSSLFGRPFGKGVLAICSYVWVWLCCVLAIDSQIGPSHPFSRLGMFAIFSIVAVCSAGRLLRDASQKITPDDLLLRDDSNSLDLLVQVWVKVNGRLVATDRGILGFASETLYFSGHSFSFLVGSQDLARRSNLWLSLNAPHLRQIGLKHSSHVSVRFSVLRSEDWDWNEKMRFLTGALKALERYKPTGTARQYPPLKPWKRDENP